MAHPEEPAAADAAAADNASKDEDEAVKKQFMASLGTDEVPKLEVLHQALAMTLPTWDLCLCYISDVTLVAMRPAGWLLSSEESLQTKDDQFCEAKRFSHAFQCSTQVL